MTWLLGLPRWAYWAAGAVALVIAALVYINHRENAAVEADRAKAAAEAQEIARRADEASTGAVEASRNDTEEGNADARKAAADEPDDPLAAAMRRLRERQGGSGPPSN